MKKLLLLSLCFALVACQEKTKDQILTEKIVGTFTFSDDIPGEDLDLDDDLYIFASAESSTEEYLADRTYKNTGAFTITIIDEDEDSIDINYSYTVTGKWRIEDSKIIYSFAIDQVKLEYVGANTTYLFEKELVEYFNEAYMAALLSSLKLGLTTTEAYPPLIVQLDEDKLVLEDNDGDRKVYKKI